MIKITLRAIDWLFGHRWTYDGHTVSCARCPRVQGADW